MWKQVRRIAAIVFFLFAAEAFGGTLSIKKGGTVPKKEYIDYYIKKGYPENVARGFASVIEEEGMMIPAPRKGDKYSRVGFSVTPTSHIWGDMGLDKRDFSKNPVTEEEALSWIPHQFKGWDLQKAKDAPSDAVTALLHAGYMSNPDKSKDAFAALVSGKPIPFPDLPGDAEAGTARRDKWRTTYHLATGLDFDGKPEGSSFSASYRLKSPARDYPKSVAYDITDAIIDPLGVARNDKQGASMRSIPGRELQPRPRSAYREMLEALARGEPLSAPVPRDLLKEAQEEMARRYPPKR